MRTKIAIVALLLIAAVATRSQALPTTAGTVDYYSDPTLSEWVGYWTKDCSGRNFRGGQVTDYWTFTEDMACGDGSCPPGTTYGVIHEDGSHNVIRPASCISNLTCEVLGLGHFGLHCH